MTRCIFVSNRIYLSATTGGVQWCTRDYLGALAAAGFEPEIFAYDIDRRLPVRLRRKLKPRPFEDLINPRVVQEIQKARAATGAEWVFLNNSEPLVLAAELKQALAGKARMVYLSHGVESTDQINDLRLAGNRIPAFRRQPAWIGRVFLAELAQRAHLAGVVCISEEDVIFERWLGSETTCFLPRPVRLQPLVWQRSPGRVGTVATLNHAPNVDGIRRLAMELEPFGSVRLRLAGGPPATGEKLAREFKCVEYLGRLSDAELEVEAATWCAFVNPIFCQARGASTKVATALGWGLPVLTTRQGARGYRWNDEALPRGQSPRELAELVVRVATEGDPEGWRRRANEIARLAPDVVESGRILKEFFQQMTA